MLLDRRLSSGTAKTAAHTQPAHPIEGPAHNLGHRTFTPYAESENLGEDHRLHSGNVKPLPASRILAHHDVISAKHIRLCLGKLRAIAFIRVSTQHLLLGADQPTNFVGIRLPAVGAAEVGRLPTFNLIKKVSFFHRETILALIAREGQSDIGKINLAGRGGSVGKDPTLGAAIVGGHGVDVGLHLLLTKSLLNQLADGGCVAARKSQQGGTGAA